MRSVGSWSSSLALALGCFLAVPVSAGEGLIAGRSPRITARDGRQIAAGGRPVYVVVDQLAEFGNFDLADAPPLVIHVEGDVEIFQLPDGSVRIVLDGDDE